MRFSLSEMTNRAKPRKRGIVSIRPISPPATRATDLFQSAFRPIILLWTGALPAILAEYERTLASLTTDAPADITARIEQPETQANAIVVLMRARIARSAERIEQWQRGRWQANVLSATGVDLGTLMGPEDVRETLEVVIERNVALVRNVSDETRRRIADATFRGLQNRTPARDVAKELRDAVAIERRRALRIAADQTTTVAGQLNEERRRQAGIDTFEWVASGKQHPREEHKARDGRLYSESPTRQGTEYEGKMIRKPPPPEDMPSVPIYCGCTSRAVLILD